MFKKVLYVCGLIVSIICLCIGAYMAGYRSGIANFDEYYEKTECLLDTIYIEYPDFSDIIMDSDTYYEYELAKDKISMK